MKLLTLAPAAPHARKGHRHYLAGFQSCPRLLPHATHILEGTRHSRTLYTSKALEQSNFIIGGQEKTGMHHEQAGPAACP
jgi:hypothetical protein